MYNKFNPYKILEISSHASNDEIAKAYKKLAIKYHPDKNKDNDAHDKFLNIKKAYEILSDPRKKSKYDKYGVCDDNELEEHNQDIMREMLMKNKLKQVIKVNIDIIELIKGIKKEINYNREIIHNRKIEYVPSKIEIELNTYTPINKPIIINDMGKEMNNIRGDLIVLLKINFSNNYRLNNNLNLVYTHNISLGESLCGVKFILPFYNLEIYYDDIIDNNNIYIIPNKGFTIEENDNNKQTNLEIIFNIKYSKLTSEQNNKLKELLHYNNSNCNINNDMLSIKLNSYKKNINKENNYYETPNVMNDNDIFSGFSGIPSFNFPDFGGMNSFGFSSNFDNSTTGNSRVHVQECQTQ